MRVVRFYISLLRLLFLLVLRLLRRRAVGPLPDLNRDSRSSSSRCQPSAGPQPRLSALSFPCRTSTTTLGAQCSLPDLNRDSLCSAFPAGPRPRLSAQCSLPDLNGNSRRSVFPAAPQPRLPARSAPCRTSTAR